jgi:iron complex outermembrane receptor protein
MDEQGDMMQMIHTARSTRTGAWRSHTHRSLQVLLASAAPFWAAAAHGQTSPAAVIAPADAGGVQDVIVTATRQTTRLQKTPVAVTVVGAEAISQQNLITARDLAGQTPGVTIQRSGITPLTQVFFIRGIGDADPIFDPNVAQYVDDVYLPRAINGMSDLADVERVEVLRGPQGTLFGENADAGAIRYITKTPTDATEASFDAGYGTFNAFNIHGRVSGAIVPGVLDGSLSIGHEQHDGYTYDPTIKQHVNNQETTGGRLKLVATLSPKLRVTFSADANVDNSATAYYIPKEPIIGGTLKAPIYGAFNANESLASQTPKNDSWTGGVSLKVAYDINDNLTFNSISAGRGFAQDPVNYNNDGQPLVAYSAADPTPVSISDNYIVYRDKEATQELQLIGKYDKVDFASGLYFLYEDFSSNRIGYVVSPTAATALPAYPEDQIGDTKTFNYAAYIQGNYHFTDKLIGTLGARYTIESRDFRFQGVYDTLAGVAITPVPGASTATPGGYAAANNFAYVGDKTWYSFTPKYGVSYQFAPSLFAYGSVSKGFDAGGFNNRASSLATALPYNQEDVTTYELGLKTDWLDKRVRLNATAFYNAYNGLQETAAVISPVTNAFVSVRSNANRAHTEGFELEGAVEPVEGLTLTSTASYLKTKFDSFANAGSTIVNGQPVLLGATGNNLPFSPEWQLFGGGAYTVPIDLNGEVRLGGDVTYESSYYSDVFNYKQGRVSAQSFSDAYISYAPKDSRWIFTLTARNLGNRIAYQSITWGGTPNLWEGPVSPPRTVFLKLAYKL